MLHGFHNFLLYGLQSFPSYVFALISLLVSKGCQKLLKHISFIWQIAMTFEHNTQLDLHDTLNMNWEWYHYAYRWCSSNIILSVFWWFLDLDAESELVIKLKNWMLCSLGKGEHSAVFYFIGMKSTSPLRVYAFQVHFIECSLDYMRWWYSRS